MLRKLALKLERRFLPLAVEIDGDAYFPELVDSEWQETSRETFAIDSKHDYAIEIFQLDRILTVLTPTGD